MKTAQVSVDRETTCACPHSEMLPRRKGKTVRIHTAAWRNLEDVILSEGSRTQKDNVCDSISLGCPNGYLREEVGRWVPGAGGGKGEARGRWHCLGAELLLGKMSRVLEMDAGDGYLAS